MIIFFHPPKMKRASKKRVRKHRPDISKKKMRKNGGKNHEESKG